MPDQVNGYNMPLSDAPYGVTLQTCPLTRSVTFMAPSLPKALEDGWTPGMMTEAPGVVTFAYQREKPRASNHMDTMYRRQRPLDLRRRGWWWGSRI